MYSKYKGMLSKQASKQKLLSSEDDDNRNNNNNNNNINDPIRHLSKHTHVYVFCARSHYHSKMMDNFLPSGNIIKVLA